MDYPMGHFFGSGLLFWIVFFIPYAIGFYFVAGRLGKPRWLWVVLSLIPGVNVVFLIYAFFAVIIGVLDRLNELTARSSAT